MWREIPENARYIKTGVRAEVGNGNKTLFWFHNQAVDETLCKYAMSPIPQEIEDTTVTEFWDTNRGWQWEKFVMLLPLDIITVISSFELYPNINNKDHQSWVGSPYEVCY